jgi:peptidyl-prolyl cis-trans isomerase SurA
MIRITRFTSLTCLTAALLLGSLAYCADGDTLEPVQYLLRQVMMEPMASPARIAVVREHAESCLDRARVGEDFAALARTLSEEPGADRTGGDLGWFTFDQMVKPFSETVYSMKPDEIRGPVRTQFGFHVIKLLGIDGDRRRARHILFTTNPGHADTVAVLDSLASIRRELQDGTDFLMLLRRHCTNGLILTTDGYMVWQRPDDMLESFRHAVSGLNAGDISEPFVSILAMHIVQVDSINYDADHLLEGLPPHIAARTDNE